MKEGVKPADGWHNCEKWLNVSRTWGNKTLLLMVAFADLPCSCPGQATSWGHGTMLTMSDIQVMISWVYGALTCWLLWPDITVDQSSHRYSTDIVGLIFISCRREVTSGQENLPILAAALTKCTFWSEDFKCTFRSHYFFSVGNWLSLCLEWTSFKTKNAFPL